MDIGKEKKKIIVEPIENPIPQKEPNEPQPAKEPAQPKEPVKV